MQAEQRESYAVQALQAAGGSQPGGGSALLVSATPNGACNTSYPLTGSIKGYTNPFEKATGMVWERTDQGVDAAMQPGSPLLAFAPSKVEMIVPDFYAGQPAIVFEITAGPLAGKWWYLSEQIQPTVSQGQTIAAGQTIATYAPAGTGIEIGWWTPGGGYPLGHPGYEEGLATNAGGDFRYLLQALGANPGTGAGMSSGPTMGNTYYPTGNPGHRSEEDHEALPADRARHSRLLGVLYVIGSAGNSPAAQHAAFRQPSKQPGDHPAHHAPPARTPPGDQPRLDRWARPRRPRRSQRHGPTAAGADTATGRSAPTRPAPQGSSTQP